MLQTRSPVSAKSIPVGFVRGLLVLAELLARNVPVANGDRVVPILQSVDDPGSGIVIDGVGLILSSSHRKHSHLNPVADSLQGHPTSIAKVNEGGNILKSEVRHLWSYNAASSAIDVSLCDP